MRPVLCGQRSAPWIFRTWSELQLIEQLTLNLTPTSVVLTIVTHTVVINFERIAARKKHISTHSSSGTIDMLFPSIPIGWRFSIFFFKDFPNFCTARCYTWYIYASSHNRRLLDTVSLWDQDEDNSCVNRVFKNELNGSGIGLQIDLIKTFLGFLSGILSYGRSSSIAVVEPFSTTYSRLHKKCRTTFCTGNHDIAFQLTARENFPGRDLGLHESSVALNHDWRNGKWHVLWWTGIPNL